MTLLDTLAELLSTPLMQRALIVAVLVGIAAPVMGTYLVQRRLALLGDGIGHVALTGVAVGWLVGSLAGAADRAIYAIPGAIIASIIGSVLIEVVRARGKTSGDIALAILFYGGIAAGVLIITMAGGTTANLNAYLFGSIAAVSTTDVVLTVMLAVLVLGLGIGLRGPLFALCHDEEFARASGLPVRALTALIAVMAALTVSVSMRVVGVLLVSALMIVPVATSQLVARSFRSTMTAAMGLGAVVSVTGLVLTYLYPLSPGATIVVLAIGVYAVVSVIRPLLGRRVQGGDPHPDVEDDVEVGKAV